MTRYVYVVAVFVEESVFPTQSVYFSITCPWLTKFKVSLFKGQGSMGLLDFRF